MKIHRTTSNRSGARYTKIGKTWRTRHETRSANTTNLEPSRQYKLRPSRVPGVHSIEIDSILLDLRVSSAFSRGQSFRPYLTIAMCTYTRAIVGWHLSLEPPDWAVVTKLLRAPGQRQTADSLRTRLDNSLRSPPKTFDFGNGHIFSREVAQAPASRGVIERTFASLARDFPLRSADRANSTMTSDQLGELVRSWIDRQIGELPHNTIRALRPPKEI
jgi:transposase InsO family protein